MLRNKKYYIIDGKKIPHIAGGKGGCFASGTLVSTPNGMVPIDHLNLGEEVFCFNKKGKLLTSKITELHEHIGQELIEIEYWGGSVKVTPNHWFLNEYNTFNEVGNFDVDDALIDKAGDITPILSIKKLDGLHKTYNLTVATHHTYIANNVRVHNKGGGKGGQTAAPGVEQPNSLFSSDILFITTALGEGPVYRINPNGIQDIEINESTTDDLINLDGDGFANDEFFHTESTTGTLVQAPLPIFGEETVTPQTMASPVNLRKGNEVGIPASKVTLQDTSVGRHDALRFIFNIQALQILDSAGNINPYKVSANVTVFDRTGTSVIADVGREVSGKTNVPFRFTLDVPIPESSKSDLGYKFTVEKTSNDSQSSKKQDPISFVGWHEIINEEFAYPRTALQGYGIKAAGEYTGGVPTFTSLMKGLLVKVPNNYDQPILESGEVDWRELELPESGTNSYSVYGYRQQSTGNTVVYATNPVIYRGLWDGAFIYSWTQNPVWVLYDLLTNDSYGLGIPEAHIDKFKFYKVAQYCDAVDTTNGTFTGVTGYADGTFRHKPRTLFTNIRETLIGIINGTELKERRFICNITISNQQQVMDLIVKISAIFRGVLFYSGGKISLNVDLPDELPVAIFNETNIEEGTLSISGIEETEILTGVEVSYIEPNNHYRREVVRIDDVNALKESTQIENISQIELSGVTRRGQAMRFGQYMLASSKYIRRKINFTTNIESINLTIGEIIAVSQRVPGTAWGYGGRVTADSTIGSSNVTLEHFTSPAISNTVFTANTLPIGLRVIGKASDRVDLYLLSNTAFTAKNTGNAVSGSDYFDVNIVGTINPKTKLFTYAASNSAVFHANNVAKQGDIWTLGEINPNSYYVNQNDKLFKVTGVTRDENEKIVINANEYVSNVYADSDSAISYTPVKYFDTISPLSSPPIPDLQLTPKLTRTPDGAVRNDIEVFISYDAAAYPLKLGIETLYASSGGTQLIESIG
jgi:hypothetical protein